jgi:hypothetical protein
LAIPARAAASSPWRLAVFPLIEQLVHYFLAIPEVRKLESSKGIRKVNQMFNRFNLCYLCLRRKTGNPVTNQSRSRGMAKFLVHCIGQKWGWCQPLPGASKAQAFKAPAFTFRVFPCVLNPYIMGLEKIV